LILKETYLRVFLRKKKRERERGERRRMAKSNSFPLTTVLETDPSKIPLVIYPLVGHPLPPLAGVR
jgi:hypothetical protein